MADSKCVRELLYDRHTFGYRSIPYFRLNLDWIAA